MSTPGLAARFAAWRILHDVRHEVPFDTARDRALTALDDADRRLAHEIAAGVFRHRSDLDQSLGLLIARGLDSVRPDTLDVLRIGAFQLRHLDRVPAHAAVQTTVALGRRLGGPKVAGFVNAILRRLATAPAAGFASEDDPASALAVKNSHPRWLVERWCRHFGQADTERLLTWNNRRPSLVIQPGRLTETELESLLDEAGIGHRPAPFHAGLLIDASKPTTLPGFHQGAFLVQDAAQRLVARYLDPEPGTVLFDACASPGGKAVALAPRVRFLVAADRRVSRIARLAETVRRLGPGNVSVISADASRPPLRSVGAVLLDVPCLGTGTFSRNPDARWRVTPEALQTLADQAAGFLRAAAEIVSPGGLLLFATCSLEPEENQIQIASFLATDKRFRREPSATVAPELLTADGDLAITPQRHEIDGAFACRLRRVG